MGVAGESVMGMSIAEDTHGWLARELHDGVVQSLTTMLVDMEIFKREQGKRGPAAQRIEMYQGATRSVISNLREVLADLRAEPRGERGYVDWVRDALDCLESETGIRTRLSVVSWPEELPGHVAFNLLRIVEEALRNARFHAGATSVEVTLQVVDGRLALTIADDGRGGAAGSGTSRPGLGIRGMHERALLLGGRLVIDSVPDQGTTVRGIFPRSADADC